MYINISILNVIEIVTPYNYMQKTKYIGMSIEYSPVYDIATATKLM